MELMSYDDAIRRVSADSRYSLQAMSRELGKSQNYMSSTLNSGRTPSVTGYASMLSVCGYGLYAIRDGECVPDGAIRIEADES